MRYLEDLEESGNNREIASDQLSRVTLTATFVLMLLCFLALFAAMVG